MPQFENEGHDSKVNEIQSNNKSQGPKLGSREMRVEYVVTQASREGKSYFDTI